jgi:hypothetical protein
MPWQRAGETPKYQMLIGCCQKVNWADNMLGAYVKGLASWVIGMSLWHALPHLFHCLKSVIIFNQFLSILAKNNDNE